VINFNEPPIGENSLAYMCDAVKNNKISGDGPFTKEVSKWFEDRTGVAKVLLATSCTHAYELAALCIDINEGDEVIMPSYTFVSTANPFVLRGAKIVFVDIDPKTMNLDANLIEDAITDRTIAIAPVHYAGVGCDMDKIMDIAKRHNLFVFEDAAQGMMAKYKGRELGTIGDFGALSFHETKNYSMGEGGLLYLRDETFTQKAEILREKGTDRSRFLRGQVDKYSWVDKGSSYLPSELNVAYLKGQLEQADQINNRRLEIWDRYYQGLQELQARGVIELPFIPDYATHNAHMFYIKVADIEVRTKLIAYLLENDILTVFHYVPLHSAAAGREFGRFHGEDRWTTRESERLLRLPLHMHLSDADVDRVINKIYAFFQDVSIRPISDADTTNIVRWRNSPHVKERFIDRSDLTEDKHRGWLANQVDTGKVMQYIMIVDGKDVGSTFIKNLGTEEPEAGLFIGEKQYLGRGVGEEALRQTLAEYFKTNNSPVIGRVISSNLPSLTVHRNLGYEPISTYFDDKIGEEVTVLVCKGIQQ